MASLSKTFKVLFIAIAVGIALTLAPFVLSSPKWAVEFVDWPPLAAQIETGDFVADISRIRDDLGWSPAVSIDEGLRRTVAFYRAHVAP